jgi:NAD(P)-dependent dehydrogenase (short-subunit alcohol dehydrogenase family)
MTLALVTGGNRGIGLEVARPTGGFFRDGNPVPW